MPVGGFCLQLKVVAPAPLMPNVRAYSSADLQNIMRALRHTGGILLATVGVILLLAAGMSISEPDPEVPAWMVAGILLGVALIPLSGAVALLWAPVTAPIRLCPQCGSPERGPAGELRKSGSLWLLHLCGWLFSSLWGASRDKQVRCTQCETLYMTDTRGTRIAGILLWVLVLLVVSGVIAEGLKRH